MVDVSSTTHKSEKISQPFKWGIFDVWCHSLGVKLGYHLECDVIIHFMKNY